MKEKFLLVAIVLLSLSVASNRSPVLKYAEPKIWALVVGVSKYQDSKIPPLKYAVNDATAFKKFLQSPQSGSIKDENLLFYTNEEATRENIIDGVEHISKMASKDDMIIFYFSGHGKSAGKKGDGYFLTYDCKDDKVPGTALKMSEVKEFIDESNAKMKISYVDACHAGLFRTENAKGGNETTNGEVAKEYMTLFSNADKGNVAFLSSRSNEQSLENDKDKMGVFAYFLMKGLQGEADMALKGTPGYNNKIVTINELQTYLEEKVKTFTSGKQNPTFTEYKFDEDFPLSVLKGSLSTEMLKRPGYTKTQGTGVKDPLPADNEPIVKDISKLKCTDRAYSYGHYCFVNNFKEPIILYFVGRVYQGECSIVIPPGKTACSDRMRIGRFANNISTPATLEVELYFRTASETEPLKFGTIKKIAEACKEITIEISPDNLVMSTTGKKRNYNH